MFVGHVLDGTSPTTPEARPRRPRLLTPIESIAATTAIDVNSGGRRGILRDGLGPFEAEILWNAFLPELERRGLRDGRLEPAYKQHAAVDDKVGVILDVEVTTNERDTIEPQVEKIQAYLTATAIPQAAGGCFSS